MQDPAGAGRGRPPWHPWRVVDRSFVAGYLGLAGFLGLEAAIRQPGGASSLEASRDDRGTTLTILSAYALAATLAPLARRLPGPRLPAGAGRLGLGLEASGLLLRAWSMRTLGRAYTRTLRTEDRQQVVDAGPYALVRHPGYLGSVATWIGFAIASRSALVVAGVGALLGRAYGQRIDAEEALLRRDLPGYRAYAERTWRLVPGVW